MTHILVVSEAPGQADAFALVLAEKGFDVEATRSTDVARERLGETAPDIVVIDVASPDSSTGMLVGQARAAWPDVMIVALTSFNNTRHSALSKMGLWAPDVTLSHPVSPERLTQRILTALEKNQSGDDPVAG